MSRCNHFSLTLDKRRLGGVNHTNNPARPMSRKYRQSGYQDDDEARTESRSPDHQPKGDGRPRRGYGPREPRKVNMPSFREVTKCARCGAALSASIRFDSQCSKCAVDLHTCAQCTWFDTSSQFECARPISKRVSPKDERNSCTQFEAVVTVERETHSGGRETTSTAASTGSAEKTASSSNARRAFDDLFK